MGHHSPSRQWDLRRLNLFLLTPAWARGTDISPKVLHKHLLLRRWATLARAWVEVEVKISRPVLQGPPEIGESHCMVSLMRTGLVI